MQLLEGGNVGVTGGAHAGVGPGDARGEKKESGNKRTESQSRDFHVSSYREMKREFTHTATGYWPPAIRNRWADKAPAQDMLFQAQKAS